MLFAIFHSLENSEDKSVRHLRVEQVAHGVYENTFWVAPMKRVIQPVFKAPNIGERSPFPKALRNPFGVAVGAPCADLRASGYRVPDFGRPFDLGITANLFTFLFSLPILTQQGLMLN
jgi:hypothetical protein